jgi:REP element-mobilizing transposase RayT
MLTHPTLRESRTVRQRSLKYHPVQFNGKQALAVGNGFASAVRRHQWSVWACSILPEHVHLVLARWKSSAEQAVVFFKAEASTELKKQGLHPAYLCDRSVWERGKWISFLDSETAIEDAIHYVEDNPVKEGKPKQKWSFVTPFAGLEKGWMTYH